MNVNFKVVINSAEEAIKIIERFLSSRVIKESTGRSLLHLPLPQAAIKYLQAQGIKLTFPYAEKSLAEIERAKRINPIEFLIEFILKSIIITKGY